MSVRALLFNVRRVEGRHAAWRKKGGSRDRPLSLLSHPGLQATGRAGYLPAAIVPWTVLKVLLS